MSISKSVMDAFCGCLVWLREPIDVRWRCFQTALQAIATDVVDRSRKALFRLLDCTRVKRNFFWPLLTIINAAKYTIQLCALVCISFALEGFLNEPI